MDRRCIHCGSMLIDGACPVCKKSQSGQNPAGLLPVGSVVAERFWVGRAVHADGEGATYIAYDNKEMRTVYLREFLPLSLCIRKPDLTILINEGSELQFKTTLTAFIDLYKALSQAETLEAVQTIYGAYKYNNTVYFALEFFDGVSLAQVLKRSSGDVSQETLLNMLQPLFNTLSALHKMGLIHGGICPENILLDDSGNVRLIGFATNSLRTADTEITSELFDGYTSPEQFSITGWQGPWTDIYALGATLYRALTGTKPLGAKERQKNDTVLPVKELNASIGDNLSRAIYYSMKLNYKERIKNIEELQEFISGKATSVTMPLEVKNEITSARAASPAQKKSNLPLWITIILAVLVVGCVALGWWLFGRDKDTNDDVPPPVNSDVLPETIKVPDIIGMTFDAFDSNRKYKDEKYSFKVEYDFHSVYDEGTICDVNPSPGREIQAGEVITVIVSKGKETVKVPSIVGKSIDDVETLLKQNNIKYEVIEMFEPSGEGGTVLRYEGDLNGTAIPGETVLYIYVVAVL